MMLYQIMIFWGARYPELNPNPPLENRGRMMDRAVRIREMEGPEHPLWYLMWEPGKRDAAGLYPITEEMLDAWNSKKPNVDSKPS